MLALNADSAVSSGRLIEGLWGEHPPATATKLVQVYVSQLRKALAAGGDGAEIVTRGRGYELRVGPDDVDAGRFERLVARGAPREALALWRGRPLDDVVDEPFAAAEIRRLEEMRLTAFELAIECDLDAGRHREVVGELERLVLDEPLRELLHAQRMLALYRSGRQSDALDAFRQARAALVDAIGVEPGPELRRLHEAILRQDPSLEPPPSVTGKLPPELEAGTPMAGREADLEWLREVWRSALGGTVRRVLLAGPRGIGKTRLAAELAGEVQHDRGLVLYACGAGAPDATLSALAAAGAARRPVLLVFDDVECAGSAVRTALDELTPRLAGRPVLLVATAEDAERAAGLRPDATLCLEPLDGAAVLAVAQVYAGTRDDADVPVERLVEESGGIPQRVHRAAADWARTEAAGRVAASAGRAAGDRAGLRAAEGELAGDVADLQALHERAGPRTGTLDVVTCPFKGLASFDVDDAEFFFGRERLVAEMVARLAGAPLLAIVGRSGSGKSSTLRAGLLPALAAGVLPGSDGWTLALLRPGEHPLRALAEATAEAADRGRLVIAVDQFEETFTACRDDGERAAFVDELVARACDVRGRTLVLVAVRADFYGRCDAYPDLARLLGANHVLVGPLRRDELRRAIELPTQRVGLRAEPELVDALIADVEGRPGALPLLSTSLLELWQQRDGRRLRLSTYRQTGGVHGAVARLAERAYEGLDPERQDIARRMLLRLAGDGEGDTVVRRRVPLAEFEGEDAAAVLSVLADERLVTIDEGEVEVAHEALLREWPRLRTWLEDDAQGRHLRAQLSAGTRDWVADARDPGLLYRGARLAAALDWSAGHPAELTANERAFLADSRAASERSQRRLRATLAGVAALLVIAVIAGLVALEQRGTARQKATAADAQRLGSRALVEHGLDRAVLLARQAVALDDTVQTRGNLRAALLKSPAAIGVLRGSGEDISALALSADARALAAGDPSGNVFLFDARTRRRVAVIEPRDALSWITQLAYSPDGGRLAIAHDSPRGNVASVFDTGSRRAVSHMTPPPNRFVSALRYSADGATLDVIAVTPDPEAGPALLTRFDARSGRRRLGPVPINRRHWSPLLATSDASRLLTAGDGEVTLRDAGTLRAVRSFSVPGSSAAPDAYALSPDDRTVAVGDDGGAVRLLDLRTGAVRLASGRHDGGVSAAAFTADGRTLVTGGNDGDVIVWDVERGTAGETLSGHANGISALQITPDGNTLYTASVDGTVFVWDLGGARRLGRPFTASTGGNPWIALSSDDRLIAMGQHDGAISLVDAQTLKPRATFPVVDSGAAGSIGFVPGSHLLVVGGDGDDGFLALIDADSGKLIRRLEGHHAPINIPGVSADGRLLTTSDPEGTVRFWSLPDGADLGRLRFTRQIYNSQLSPDGRWLSVVLVNRDFASGNLEIWDARSRRRVHNLPTDGPVVTRFSPDSKLLTVGTRTRGTRVWSTKTWTPVTRFLSGDAGGILAAVVSRDGRTLATGSTNGTVRLWDIPTQQNLGALPGETSQESMPQFTRDGSRLIAAYDGGRAYLWDMRPARLIRQACQVAGRQLTRAEWAEFLPGRDYGPAC